jgi:ketosteroid isomerase-like protein
MSQENVEVIRDVTAAINEGDFERAMGHLADDVVLEAPAGILGGTFRGREAVGAWFGIGFESSSGMFTAIFGRSPRSATTASSWSPLLEAGVGGVASM